MNSEKNRCARCGRTSDWDEAGALLLEEEGWLCPEHLQEVYRERLERMTEENGGEPPIFVGGATNGDTRGVLVVEHGRRQFTAAECKGDTTSIRYEFETALIRAGWHTFAISHDDGGVSILWGLPKEAKP